MNISALQTPYAAAVDTFRPHSPAAPPASTSTNDGKSSEFRQAFDDFVGQTFYGQMLSSMRKSVGKPAYFHGGRTEEVFQAQLDQVMAEQLAKKTADSFTGPLFELYTLPRF